VYDRRCCTTNSPNTAICWDLSKTQFTHHKVLFITNFGVSPTLRWCSINCHLRVFRLPRSANAAALRISDWRLDVKLETTEHNLIAHYIRIDKSEAEVTNNKRGIVLLKYWQTRHCPVSVRPSVTYVYSIQTTKPEII